MTPLGTPVEPEVNSSFAMVSGPGPPCARCLPAAPGGAEEVLEPQCPVALPAGDERLRHGGRERVEGVGERSGVVGEHQAGFGQLRDRPDPGVVGAHQRVGDADRHHRHAGGVGAEAYQQVLERIARQDHQRLVGSEPEVRERLRQGVGFALGVAVGERDPLVVAVALGRQRAVRVLGGPLAQQRPGSTAPSRPAPGARQARPSHRPGAPSRCPGARTSGVHQRSFGLTRGTVAAASTARSASASARCWGRAGVARPAFRGDRCCRPAPGSPRRPRRRR